MQNITELEKKWEERKAKLKLKFSKLKDNDVLLVEGKLEGILDGLQVKLSKTKEEIRKIISEL